MKNDAIFFIYNISHKPRWDWPFDQRDLIKVLQFLIKPEGQFILALWNMWCRRCFPVMAKGQY